MSKNPSSEPSTHNQSNLSGLKSKKHRKKKGAGNSKVAEDLIADNGTTVEEEYGTEEAHAADLGPRKSLSLETAGADVEAPVTSKEMENRVPLTNGLSRASNDLPSVQSPEDLAQEESSPEDQNDSPAPRDADPPKPVPASNASQFELETNARLDALATERAALRAEVSQLRRSLEEVQERHEEELAGIREQLATAQDEKEHAETQYHNLLGKVNTIKSQLGERLKADAEDLSQARRRIDDLEAQCGTLREQNEARVAELAVVMEENERRSKELSTLRNRTTLSQQNWSKEREDLIRREAFAKEEFEAAKQAMQDWEVLAMEERSIRENIADRVADLEEQLSNNREAYEKAASERDAQSLTVDGLQRALQEIQDARRRELRELVENSQAQIESLQKQLREAELQGTEAKTSLEATLRDLERALPFEREVKEKNLLIGKLRHEAVTLNDHLTKALRYLKKGKPDENIDKQLITNHFLHFLALERSDPKKFQVLQIIAALLGWADEQREQAGLARPGASNPALRVPISPWHRTPSTPSLSSDFFPESGGKKESLAELWSEFLEQEAQDGIKSPSSPSVSQSGKTV